MPVQPARTVAPPGARRNTGSSTGLLVRGACVVYAVALCWIVFAPGGDAGHVTGVVATVAEALGAWGVPFDTAYPVLEFTANIALFVPFGLLLSLQAPLAHPVLVIATGLALSCAIELVQLGIPSRVSAASDLLANTLGTALGVVLLAAGARALLALQGRRARASPAPSGRGELALQ